MWTRLSDLPNLLSHILRASVMYTEKCVMKTHTSMLTISEKNSGKSQKTGDDKESCRLGLPACQVLNFSCVLTAVTYSPFTAW